MKIEITNDEVRKAWDSIRKEIIGRSDLLFYLDRELFIIDSLILSLLEKKENE